MIERVSQLSRRSVYNHQQQGHSSPGVVAAVHDPLDLPVGRVAVATPSTLPVDGVDDLVRHKVGAVHAARAPGAESRAAAQSKRGFGQECWYHRVVKPSQQDRLHKLRGNEGDKRRTECHSDKDGMIMDPGMPSRTLLRLHLYGGQPHAPGALPRQCQQLSRTSMPSHLLMVVLPQSSLDYCAN
jgi:hypothetical protein